MLQLGFSWTTVQHDLGWNGQLCLDDWVPCACRRAG